MRRVLLLLCLIWFNTITFSQPVIPDIKNGQEDKFIPDSAIMLPIIKKSEVVIMYRGFSFFNQHSPFHIINYGVDKKWHYSEIATTETDSSFKRMNMPQDTIIKIWKAFVNNGLFDLKDEPELEDNCHDRVADGAWIDINIITKTACKGLHYYAASYMKDYCLAKEHDMIDKCLNIIFSINYEKYRNSTSR